MQFEEKNPPNEACMYIACIYSSTWNALWMTLIKRPSQPIQAITYGLKKLKMRFECDQTIVSNFT